MEFSKHSVRCTSFKTFYFTVSTDIARIYSLTIIAGLVWKNCIFVPKLGILPHQNDTNSNSKLFEHGQKENKSHKIRLYLFSVCIFVSSFSSFDLAISIYSHLTAFVDELYVLFFRLYLSSAAISCAVLIYFHSRKRKWWMKSFPYLPSIPTKCDSFNLSILRFSFFYLIYRK